MKYFVIYFFLFSSLFASLQQTWLPNNVWSLVSYKGKYNFNNALNWKSDEHNVLQDLADNKYTYVSSNATSNDHQYNLRAPFNTYSLIQNETITTNSVIGIFAIKNSLSPSGATLLNEYTDSAVSFKFENVENIINNQSYYSMYIAGFSNKPAVRLKFISSYQGHSFKIRFGNENISYKGVFNYRNTFDNPLDLVDDSSITSKIENSDILDVFDFNSTDNSMKSLLENSFNVSFDTSDQLFIYSYDSKTLTWNKFNSLNINSYSNSIKNLQSNQSYWVKVSSQNANLDGNKTRIAMLSSKKLVLKNDYYSNVSNGWNLLMLDDSYIRVATTGLILNRADVAILLSKPDELPISSNGDIKRAIVISNNTELSNSIKQINLAVYAYNMMYGASLSLTAYPAFENNASKIILLSDELIYFSSTTVNQPFVRTLTGSNPILLTEKTTLTGGAVVNTYSSVYGEYILVARLNKLKTLNIPAKLNISIPSISSEVFTSDTLSQLDNMDILSKINNTLNASARGPYSTLQTKVASYLIDIDMNDTIRYSVVGTTIADASNKYNSVLLASGERFSISDNTYTKAYKYKRNGDFRIVGSVTRDVKMDNNVSIADLQTQFNAVSADTDVIFTILGQDTNNEYFAITSDKVSNLDLLEDESNGTTLFEEISLDSTVIPEANRSRMLGAIERVYDISNLLNTKVDFRDANILSKTYESMAQLQTDIDNSVNNGNLGGTFKSNVPYKIKNLKSNPVWSLDFPVDSIIEKFAKFGRNIDVITTLQTSLSDGNTFWQTTDLTKDPQNWYGNNYNDKKVFDNDLQGVFKIKSNKAYWVKLSSKTKVLGTLQSSSTLSKNTIPHFDNSVKSKDDPVSPTSNDLNYKLVLYFNKNFINPLSKSFYDVVALIDGKRYHLRSSGSNFQLDIRNKEMSLIQKKAGSSAYPIIIEASDGLGNTFKETAKTAKFKIDYVQPPTPKIEYDEVSEINVLNKGNYKVEAYANYISDIESVRMKDMMDFNLTHHITRFKDMIGWEKEDSTPENEGLPTLVKVVNKNKSTGMYSDAQTLIYAPLKFGHVLEVNASDKDGVDNLPYSFIQKQPLTKQSVNSDKKILFNGVNGINGGVQLTRQAATKTTLGYKGVKLAYYPAGGENKEDSNELSRFGGRYTMYLKVNSSDNDPIASITYITDLVGKVFYVEYDSKLYIGRFAGNDNFNGDTTAYALNFGDSINVMNFNDEKTTNLSGHGKYIDFGEDRPVQLIVQSP